VRQASTLAPSRCLIKIFPPAFVKLIFQFGKRKKKKSTCHHGIPAFFSLLSPCSSFFFISLHITGFSLSARVGRAEKSARARTRPNLDLGLKSLLPASTHGPKIFNLRYVPKSLKIREITFSQKDKRKGNREREREREGAREIQTGRADNWDVEDGFRRDRTWPQAARVVVVAIIRSSFEADLTSAHNG